MLNLELVLKIQAYKFAVVYSRAGQRGEDALDNKLEDMSPRSRERFLMFLDVRVCVIVFLLLFAVLLVGGCASVFFLFLAKAQSFFLARRLYMFTSHRHTCTHTRHTLTPTKYSHYVLTHTHKHAHTHVHTVYLSTTHSLPFLSFSSLSL
jgi:uncharacterized protein YceK